ncbi:hypothetical protein [Yoonia sp. 2307UL14-13]|uniref:hypothetical protein n=1 Tax=Yoonia sp. 2307UL14-13 TaxID=3126506 RepID=UPI0030A10F1A
MLKYRFQVASNVINDSLSVEVLNEAGNCVAAVERFDTTKKLKLSIFSASLDVAFVREILELADKELVAFEDNTPLYQANRDEAMT